MPLWRKLKSPIQLWIHSWMGLLSLWLKRKGSQPSAASNYLGSQVYQGSHSENPGSHQDCLELSMWLLR